MIRMPHTVYVDDSGTHSHAQIVVAAYCVAPVKNWKQFESAWSRVGREAGFKHFHMTEFASCRIDAWCRDCKKGKTDVRDHPWREWTLVKRKRVLKRLANIVAKHVQQGAGLSLAKAAYAEFVLQPELAQLAEGVAGCGPFTFAMQGCGGHLAHWRATNHIDNPMKFVFDLTDEEQMEENERYFFGSQKRPHIVDGVEQFFIPLGGYRTGVAYESRKDTVQLLAADMLAWTSSKICAAHWYKAPVHEDALDVAFIFKESGKLNIGNVGIEEIQRWARREIELRRQTILLDKRENEPNNE